MEKDPASLECGAVPECRCGAAPAPATNSNTDNVESKMKVVYKFCDLMPGLVEEWKNHFKDYIPESIQVYQGDIFKEGPAADAIVSPANSFGFMDGGIDMVYSRHFGWQMQERLQKKIREEFNGELLVGQATIITTTEAWNKNTVDWSKYNQGEPIQYLISAPTMRVPMDVSETANAYVAFRGIILEVNRFNKTAKELIRSVLCPGLGTAVGRMPYDMCAYQMLKAYETFELGVPGSEVILAPPTLHHVLAHFCDIVMIDKKDIKKTRPPPKNQTVKKFTSKTKTVTPAKTLEPAEVKNEDDVKATTTKATDGKLKVDEGSETELKETDVKLGKPE